MNLLEFWCPYCQAWITDVIHEQHHHNNTDEPDERRDFRTRRAPVPPLNSGSTHSLSWPATPLGAKCVLPSKDNPTTELHTQLLQAVSAQGMFATRVDPGFIVKGAVSLGDHWYAIGVRVTPKGPRVLGAIKVRKRFDGGRRVGFERVDDGSLVLLG